MARSDEGGGTQPSWLQPFAVRNFRLQWPADLLVSLAFEMELIVLGWYILAETGSVLWLTAFGALQFHGTLISPIIGVIGDRLGHRQLLAAMRGWYLTLATAITLLALAGTLGPWSVLGIAGLMGIVRPSDLAVRGATVAGNVPPGVLVSAMAISRSTSDVARIFGALAGATLLAQLGMASAYMAITGLYATGLALTLMIRAAATRRDLGSVSLALASPWRDLLEGLAYVRRTPQLHAAMWLAFLMNMTTLPLSGGLLPYVAKGVYQTDQTGLGLLSASFACGALVGSVALSVTGRRIRPARTMLVAGIIWCLFLMVFAVTGSIGSGLAMLALVGTAQSFCMVTLAIMLLKTSEERLRGRVMGVRMLAIFSQVVGLPLAGVLIGWLGYSATALLYAGSALAVTALIALLWRKDLWPASAVANQNG